MKILIRSVSESNVYDEMLKMNGAIRTSFKHNHGRGSDGEGWLLTISSLEELLRLTKEIEKIEHQSAHLLGGTILESADFSEVDAGEDFFLTIYDYYC